MSSTSSLLPLPTQADTALGRIIYVSGSAAKFSLEGSSNPGNHTGAVNMGSLVKVRSGETFVIGIISSLHAVLAQREADREIHVADIEMVGELRRSDDGDGSVFSRGVGSPPAINDSVHAIAESELASVFASQADDVVSIGCLSQNPAITAVAQTHELLAKHFAVVGSTGSGKSCAVALLLQSILKTHRQAHIVVLDPHDEYSSSFGDMANVITAQTLRLPCWLFNFEEICEVLTKAESKTRHEEIDILNSLILRAKMNRLNDRNSSRPGMKKRGLGDGTVSVDTPIPYLISDLLKLIDQEMGRLENKNNLEPYLQLKRRISTLSADKRYEFMFDNGGAGDRMRDIIGHIFRIPVDGKPISIVDISAIPAEITNVVISVMARMAYELAVWSDRKIPILLVCEEAHRYVPNDAKLGFAPTRRAIARIAKEGRKYGVSLGIVSQRPSELDPTILSQCSTMFALRLTNERDQKFAAAAVSDSAGNLLSFLPAMGTGEAMVFGESVSLPMRVRLDVLPQALRPHSHSASFCEIWTRDDEPWGSLDNIISYWRRQSRSRQSQMPPAADGQQQGLRANAAQPAVAAHGLQVHDLHEIQPQMAAATPRRLIRRD